MPQREFTPVNQEAKQAMVPTDEDLNAQVFDELTQGLEKLLDPEVVESN